MSEFTQYRCEDCGAVFDEPVIRKQREDLNGEGAWMTWYDRLCPECGSEDIEDAETDLL